MASLKWKSWVHNSVVGQLRATLVASDTKDHGVGKCSIEVWAEDNGEELAYCRGIVCPRDGHVRVLWLGRSDSRTVHPRIRGRRCVHIDDTKYTAAEAVFGIVIAISSLFDVPIVELQAQDNGSGRLIDYYRNLGFVKQVHKPDEIAWMEAPIVEAARLAPAEWVSALVPATFDANDWLQDAVMYLRWRSTQRYLLSPRRC